MILATPTLAQLILACKLKMDWGKYFVKGFASSLYLKLVDYLLKFVIINS